MPIPTVDAHHHFWDLERNYLPWLRDRPVAHFRYGDYTALRRSYLPDDYARDTARQNIVKSVYIEAEWDPADPLGETRWVHDLAARTGRPDAVIAQAWLDRADVGEVLAGQAAFPLVRGIRHKPAAAAAGSRVVEGAPGSMSDPAWRRGYALLARHGLHFELQAPCWHLPEAARLARDFPETTIVLNHTGLPADRSAAGLALWRNGMAALAAEPNTAVKISGLGLKGRRWSEAENRDIVLETIRIFGVGRCMFASNFPVDGLVGDFDTIFDGFRRIAADLPEAEQRLLFHDNACRYYRLQPGGL
jgi:predicted TIM-barrel fold metal-dependent hydrolase